VTIAAVDIEDGEGCLNRESKAAPQRTSNPPTVKAMTLAPVIADYWHRTGASAMGSRILPAMT